MYDILLLLSGGVDSAVCLAFYQNLGRSISTLFIDYGQPAVEPERQAARRVSEYYSVPLAEAGYEGNYSIRKPGFIQGRNGLLLFAACMEAGSSVNAIAIGVHAGTSYGDCSPSFIKAASELVQFSTDGRVEVVAPFLEWSKGEIGALCNELQIPTEITHSCELGDPPCGHCRSCSDRSQIC